jgi:hypothetical protein
MGEPQHDLRAEILLELWPAPTEAIQAPGTSHYLGALRDFYASVHELYDACYRADLSFLKYTDEGNERGTPIKRAFPPEVVEMLMYLTSVASSVSLYKLLKLWVDHRNGRRLKVSVDGLEIEATQLTQQQFLDLVQTIQAIREGPTTAETPSQIFRAIGFDVRTLESQARAQERLALHRLIIDSRANRSPR